MRRKYTLLGSGILVLAFLLFLIPASMPAGFVMLLAQALHLTGAAYWNYLALGISELLLILPLILYMAITGTSVRAMLGNRTTAPQLLLAAAIGVLMAPAIQGVSDLFYQIFQAMGLETPDTSVLNPTDIGTMLAGMVAIGATAGIVEEPIFRGVALRGMGSVLKKHTAVWLSALVFSLIHLDIMGAPTRLLIGVLLGYMAWSTGAVLPGVITHAAYNATLVGMSLLFTTTLKDWAGFTIAGASTAVNSVLTSMTISLPFLALLALAWWAFRRVTPATAAWKPEPYAEKQVRFPHWLPWIGLAVIVLVMTAFSAFASTLDIQQMMDQFKQITEQIK